MGVAPVSFETRLTRIRVPSGETFQLRNSLAFALKPLAELRVAGNVCWENFDRDGTIQACVFRLVDLAHPPGADLSGDFVWAQAGARGERMSAAFYAIEVRKVMCYSDLCDR
jgi:hypothetical protein